MASAETMFRVYEDLADHYARAKEARQRDTFLVLAADAAVALGRYDDAERIRSRLLLVSPHSLLKPFASFAEALKSSDIRLYVDDLKRQFPPEEAEKLLQAQRDKSDKGGFFPMPSNPPAQEPDLKVYRLQGHEDTLTHNPPEKPRSNPSAPPPAKPKPPARPAPMVPGRHAVFAPPRTSVETPETSGKSDDDDEDNAPGSWLTWIMILAVLLLGLGVTAYTLLMPFLRR